MMSLVPILGTTIAVFAYIGRSYPVPGTIPLTQSTLRDVYCYRSSLALRGPGSTAVRDVCCPLVQTRSGALEMM